MTKPRAPLIQAAIAVVERNGRYLISRRNPHEHLGGLWEFPGGKRRVGESWDTCLSRELREELGIHAQPIQRLPSLSFRYPDRQVHLAVFRCAITKGQPWPLASREVRWVRPAQLRRYRFPPANRPLIHLLSKTNQLRRWGAHAILPLQGKKEGP